MSTASITIRVLGELAVVAGTKELPLPRSRKTRALLGYLSLTGRAHRREQLCDLFWDVTDDPRAALRWSLSKLRKVLEVSGESCLLATRTHVQVRLAPGALDMETLRSAARRGFEACSSDELEALATSCQGELLEGLFLPDFDAFEAWLEAERAEARALHGRLRRELVARHADAPERALAHARAWLARSGADEAQTWVRQLSLQLESRGARAPEPRLTPPHAAAATVATATALSPAALSPAALSVAALSPVLAAPAPAAFIALAHERPLVGRDREISRLCLIAEEARLQRGGRIALVLGEPGMGKTRLLEELRGRLGPLAPSTLDVTFYEAERHRPLAPFLDAARDRLPAPPPSSGDATADREHLFETLSAVIRRGADERGLGLLLLDDAHVADASSCELLHYVVRTAARTPLVTVLACRPAELDDNTELARVLVALRRRYPVEEIHLQPLPPEAVAKLVQREAPGAALDPLVQDSAGNPLVALEMARASATGGGVSRTLSDLVLTRLAGLPEATTLLVRWASVIERGPVSLLEASCGQPPGSGFMDALETASRYALLRIEPSGTRFAMAHALIRRVVYEGISPVRRAAMHRRVAEILSEAPGAEHGSPIAHHATLADRPDLAARALIDGAERSARVGGVLEAAALAERAIELVPLLEPALALTSELEARLVLAQVQRPADPARFVSRLTELGLAALDRGQPADAHRAFHSASALRWEAGSGRDGYGLARQAWHASRSRSGIERARASSYMALCLAMMEKQLPDAHALLFEAEAVARSVPNAAEPTELVLARGQLHLHAGRWADGRRDAADARLLARAAHNTLQEAVALQMLMQIEHAAGDPLATQEAAEALAALSTRMREGGEASMAAAGLALVLPDLERARPALSEATLKLRELDDKRRLCWVSNRWAQRERREGEREAARALASRALEAARAVEAHSEAAIATCELMAAAAGVADDAAYAAAEAALAELENDSTLSHEARRWIELVTKTPDSNEHLTQEPLDGARHR